MPRKQTLHHSQVVLYGRCGELKDNISRASLFARNRQGNSICLIVPPKPDDRESCFSILEKYLPNAVVNSNGVILSESHEAVMVESHDAPIVVIEHLYTGKVAVLRAGREQLINRYDCCSKTGVIERLIPELGPLDGKQLCAYITGGISAKHFCHMDSAYIQPFVDLYGQEVIRDELRLTLDLVSVISAILRKFGVPKSYIHHDGLCTYSTPWLGSRRAKKDGANWTLVVKQ